MTDLAKLKAICEAAHACADLDAPLSTGEAAAWNDYCDQFTPAFCMKLLSIVEAAFGDLTSAVTIGNIEKSITSLEAGND